MDLRKAFHAGRVEGEALRNNNAADIEATRSSVLEFVEELRGMKTHDGKDAFHVADRDFVKNCDSFMIWANGYSNSLTLSVYNEQPVVRMEAKIREADHDGEYSTTMSEKTQATTADEALEKICHWVGLAAPQLEAQFDDTFDRYDFQDAAL